MSLTPGVLSDDLLSVLSSADSDAAATRTAMESLAARIKDRSVTPAGLDIESFFALTADAARPVPVLDVRSPGEFAKGHIPGARNVPLYSNDERASVGTTFVQISREDAMVMGMAFVAPKLLAIIAEAKAALDSAGDTTSSEGADESAGSPQLVVHCWRGGMRSGAVAYLLRCTGLRVATLDGGYKTFRTWVTGCWGGLALSKQHYCTSQPKPRFQQSEINQTTETGAEAARLIPGLELFEDVIDEAMQNKLLALVEDLLERGRRGELIGKTHTPIGAQKAPSAFLLFNLPLV
jgi:rhodanese-related sulfurtransferase